jgi:hypothetical protein
MRPVLASESNQSSRFVGERGQWQRACELLLAETDAAESKALELALFYTASST